MFERKISRRLFLASPIITYALVDPQLAHAEEALNSGAALLDNYLYLPLIENDHREISNVEMLPDYLKAKMAVLGGSDVTHTEVDIEPSFENHPTREALAGTMMQTYALVNNVYQELLSAGKISGSVTHMFPVETLSLSSPDGNYAKTQLGITNNKVQLGVNYGDDLVERGAAANESSHTILDIYALMTRYPYMFTALSEGASYVMQSMWYKYRNTSITDPSIHVDLATGESAHMNEIVQSYSYRDYYKAPTPGVSPFKTIVSNMMELHRAFGSDIELALMGEHLGTLVSENVIDRVDGVGQVAVLWDYILRQNNPNIGTNLLYQRITELQNDGTLPSSSLAFPENQIQLTSSIEHEIMFNLDNKGHYGVMVYAPVKVNGVFSMPGVTNTETWLIRNGQTTQIQNEGSYTIGGTSAKAVLIDPDIIGGNFQDGDKIVVKADFTYTGPDGKQVTQRREDIIVAFNGFDPKANTDAVHSTQESTLTDEDTQWIDDAMITYSLPESDREMLAFNIHTSRQQSEKVTRRKVEITGHGENELVAQK